VNVLAIDCTRRKLVVCVKNRGRWFSYSGSGDSIYSTNVNSAIEKTLADAGLDFGSVGAYCCNVGPGSFTGIRISVATIKGFNFGFDKKFISVNTFELMTYNTAGAVTALIPDNRGYFHAAVKNGAVVSEPLHIEFEKFKVSGKEIVFNAYGDYADALQSVCDRKIISGGGFCADFEPLYVRRSQAEELYGGRR